MDGFSNTDDLIERYMVSHLVTAMPEHIRKTLLRSSGVCSGDVLFQAMVDAGPGTKEDRTRTLQSVGSKGPQVLPHAVYDRLQQWKFDMDRLHSLGVVPPDPSVQTGVLAHFVGKLAEANPEFCYRLNAYSMPKDLHGAVTQTVVEDLWKYLASESREFHGKTSERAQQSKTASAASQTPQGASSKNADSTKKVDDDKPAPKAKGKGK